MLSLTNMQTWVIVVIIVLLGIILYMYKNGGVYQNKIEHCEGADGFCGLRTFKYMLPSSLQTQLETLVNSDMAKRVNIPNWKAGRTISTQMITKHAPEVISWYTDFQKNVSTLVDVPVKPTSLDLPTSCCILVYDEEDDFINWHFDVNYFDGRFFTVLIPITNVDTCTKFLYKDHKSDNKAISLGDQLCVVFEGDNLFHMASKLCKNEKRAILSLQYSTNPNISLINSMFMRLKDGAYVWF